MTQFHKLNLSFFGKLLDKLSYLYRTYWIFHGTLSAFIMSGSSEMGSQL